MGKKKSKEAKGKTKRKNRVPSKKWESIANKNKVCPKCGPGVFLANHKNRTSCGKCGYTEFKKIEAPKEEK